MKSEDLTHLKQWFISQKRDLPWRDNLEALMNPYAIWISEVMLQQTQVSVVIPYFYRWMNRFPTIEALANASLDEVIKEWEGLGYYSRARNLHEGAKQVIQNHQGVLPSTAEELSKIKGLGHYTVGAILNFAFHQRAAAVDGNVLRVLSRYYCSEDDISKTTTVKKIQDQVLSFLPEKEPWIASEALIELGATVCIKKPKCMECPLKRGCQGLAQGKATELPFKSAKSKTILLFRLVTLIVCEDQILIKKGEKGKVMADLYEFPYLELPSSEIDLQSQISKVAKTYDLELDWKHILPEVKHSFTNYRAHLFPHFFQAHSLKQVLGLEWQPLKNLKKLPFSSGHRRILSKINLDL